MGLDQYLYIQDSSEYDTTSFDRADWNLVGNPHHNQPNTWRKFDELEDALEELWLKKKQPKVFANEADADADSIFNCVFVKITIDELESIFRSIDSEFDTPIEVNYQEPDKYEHLSTVEYYRKHNHDVLQQMKDAGDTTFLYTSWW